MKVIKCAVLAAAVGACLSSASVQAGTWFACGQLNQFTVANGGVLPSYSPVSYEYGIKYNSQEPLPVVVTTWNVGIRVYNKAPYMVWADTPTAGMKYGGFIFYDGTYASDDNCPNGTLRQRYWYVGSGDTITLIGGTNGCYSSLQVYCRTR